MEKSGSGHLKAKDPQGATMVTMPSTPSDSRSVANTISDLKKAGARIERAQMVKARGTRKGLRKDSVDIPWMRELRRAKNISQKDLAESIGMSQGGLHQAEGAGRMKEKNAKRAAGVLDVTMDELTGKVTPMIFADRFIVENPEAGVTEGGAEGGAESRQKLPEDYSPLPLEQKIVGQLAADALQQEEHKDASPTVVRHELGPETLQRFDRVLDILTNIFGGPRPWRG